MSPFLKCEYCGKEVIRCDNPTPGISSTVFMQRTVATVPDGRRNGYVTTRYIEALERHHCSEQTEAENKSHRERNAKAAAKVCTCGAGEVVDWHHKADCPGRDPWKLRR